MRTARGNELLDSIPAFARNSLMARVQNAFIRVREGALEICDARSPTNNWRPFGHPENEIQLRRIAPTLLLPPPAVLRRIVELPSVAASNLHQVISFQIGRITPFELDRAYHVERPIGPDRAKKTIRVEVAVVPRVMLDRMLATVTEHRLPLSAVLVEDDRGKPALDFLPYQTWQGPSPETSRGRHLWAGCILLLFAFALVAAYRIHAAATLLSKEVATAAKIVPRAVAARSELEGLIASETFLPERLKAPRAVELVDALARTIPDDTWLFRLELHPGYALLSGFSGDLSGLLHRLDTDPFSTPELTSPVVNAVAGNRNRFDIRVRFRAAAS